MARRWFDSWWGAAAASEDAGDCCRSGRAQEVCLYVHQCFAAEREAASVQAEQVSFVFGSRGWATEHHDFSVCREGGYDIAMEGVRVAVEAGFRVTTNTTLFDGADPNSVRAHFDELMVAGVESMMVSPGYTYDKAPDQKHFLGSARSKKLFRSILSNRKKTWRFNASPTLYGVFDGQEGPDLHTVGDANVQHLRLAEAVLPVAGRICGQLQGVDGDSAVVELWDRKRESAVCELHGALWL